MKALVTFEYSLVAYSTIILSLTVIVGSVSWGRRIHIAFPIDDRANIHADKLMGSRSTKMHFA